MKRTFLLSVFLLYFFTSNAQHKISGYVGWTASKLQVYSTANMPNFTPNRSFLHSPYLAMEYEYDWKKLRLSTGFSTMAMGASDFYGKGVDWGGIYINIPVIAGIKWNLPKNWSITAETGIEAGLKVAVIGVNLIDDVDGFLNGVPHKRKVQGNINTILGLEANWKRFRFGARFQVGLTDFNVWNDTTVIKHLGITTYIGYTIWDSKLAKERKTKRV